MKSIVIKEAYGLENISIEDQAIPAIQPNEVLVKVQAISLNQLDLMIPKGLFGTSLPHILGSDAVGDVVETGSLVTELKVGDRVSTHFIQGWQSGSLEPHTLTTRLGVDVQGVFSEYIALPQSSLVKIAQNLTAEQASTLPVAGVTAWEALVNAGQLQAGQTVLLQGTGGVSILALQFAKAMGAKVIITSGSDEKLERAKLLGADETINYRTFPNWQEEVLKLTNGIGVDLALEVSWTEIEKTCQAMKLGGKIAVVGLLGGLNTNLSAFGIIHKSLSVIGVQVGSKETFEAMNRAILINNIKPVVDRVYKLDEVIDAFKYLDQGGHFGKVVITF